MSRPFTQIAPASPRRRRNGNGLQETRKEVKGLRELRIIAGKAQAEVAVALRIKQPSVSKVESQSDMYLSTLRAYVEAIGGKLELIVRIPQRPAPRFYRLSNTLGRAPPARQRSASQRRRRTTAAS